MAAFRYYCKFNDQGEPAILFRADGQTEEVLNADGWGPAPGFLEDIADGGFQYGPIGEAAAAKAFPMAFA